jgi:diguanylate cyclase (GGDEF)-like protein
MAFTDSLTGLRDRRYFKVKLQEELQRSRRYHKPFSIVMADLDKLKDINDTHGHAAGDRALKDIGAFFMSQIRDVDIVARYGGDEFILFFPEKGKDAAHHLSERLRNGINHNLTVNSSALSISVGIASYPEDGTDIEALIDKADKAMYQAKRMGRNRIESYSDSTP